MNSSLMRRVGQHWLWWLAYISISLVLLALTSFVWLDFRQARNAQDTVLSQDLLWQEQGLRLHLQTNQNAIENLAYGLSANALREEDFRARADGLLRASPEMLSIDYVNSSGKRVWGLPAYSSRPRSLVPLDHPLLLEVIDGAATLGYVLYSTVIMSGEPKVAQVVLVVPIFKGTVYLGAVLASYALPAILQQRVPWWMVQRYDLSLLDDKGNVLAPHDARINQTGISRAVGFEPLGHGLKLRASVRHEKTPVTQLWLLGVVFVLLVSLLWALTLLKKRMQQRQRAEGALRDEMRFRAAMEDSLTTGLLAINTSGHLIYANLAFCSMVGRSQAELLGKSSPMPYWAPEELSACAAAWNSLLSGECPVSGFALRFMRRDGERFDVRLYSSRLVDGRGEHRGWMASLYDVTELQSEREALAESRKQLLTVLEGLDAAVSVFDVDSGVVRYRNRHHNHTFPLQADGACCMWPFLPMGEATSERQDPISGRWFLVQRRRIQWVDGLVAWLEIAADITERRQIAEEERGREEKLQHTARLVSMGELASSLAHELNQPLAAIAGYAAAGEEILSRDEKNSVRHILAKMGEQARRAGQIISGIRNFSSRRAPRSEPCDFVELLAVPMQLLEPMARKYQSRIVLDLSSDLPNVMGDGVMLEQVLFNLIKNGMEAMIETPVEQREIKVSAYAGKDWLEVCVADRGSGIENPALLFQSFYTSKPEGMGIGLNICRSVIEQHQGHLKIQANPDGGSCFIFRLPIVLS
ncbi:PAS domain-containing sensor histidine kinase [Iodobacter ciconiae]|uniref:histidine kinase n=1 Tax=Iodobacter ciconiae TaxID=2496266 RepID=A0A3S8ZQW1_9NEIS|nr:PAS domain-containing sensor histidine kinase [Iodobacter ciconiae]AZN35854.1 PAS domain-containing sensor histidine kinase [Iodobacter ciconiae]